ncbi:MAG: hypothetical protein Q9208_006906 [Pyrenodesmia sp. 3 TL-2023]
MMRLETPAGVWASSLAKNVIFQHMDKASPLSMNFIGHLNPPIIKLLAIGSTELTVVKSLLTKTTTHAQVKAQQLQSFLQSLLGPEISVRKKIRRKLLIMERRRLQTFLEDIKAARAGMADSLAISTLFCTIHLPVHKASVERAVNAWEPRSPRLGRDQSMAAVESLISRVQRHMTADDGPMQHRCMQTGHELGTIHSELQKLTRLLISPDLERRGRLTKAVSDGEESYGIEGSDEALVGRRNTSSQQDLGLDAVEIFYDCASQLSDDCARDYQDQERLSLLASPVSYFESGRFFYGERYTTENRVGEIAAAVDVFELPCTRTHRLQRYHLIYAETARSWRRVTVSATIQRAPQFGSSTSTTTPVIESYPFEILPFAVVAEDLEESRRSDEKKILREIDHTGCHQYLESEVIVKKLIKSSTFLVQVEGQTYIERKMPFSRAALPGEDGVKEFYDHLKMAYSLRDCDSVVKFVGVVLDDTRSHLKSYLQEYPALVSVRLDGGIALSLRSHGHIYRHSVSHEGVVNRGSVIRGHGMIDTERRSSDFCADIFELGHTLWMIAEHKGNTHGYCCSRNACTSVPRYSCQAEHANPFELPPCSDKEAPPWFDDVISQCRKADSKQRSTARDLLQYFEKTAAPPALADLKADYSETGNHNVSCDECGTYVGFEIYYHCNTCNLGDFDLCQHCVSQGIHCPDEDHMLIQRRIEEGLFISER